MLAIDPGTSIVNTGISTLLKVGTPYTYGGDEQLIVNGYTDATWNTDLDDSKSQSRYVFTLNGAAVSWRSAKQSVVVRSSTESEYITASEASQEAIWMKEFIIE